MQTPKSDNSETLTTYRLESGVTETGAGELNVGGGGGGGGGGTGATTGGTTEGTEAWDGGA